MVRDSSQAEHIVKFLTSSLSSTITIKLNNMDKDFIVKMLEKHCSHLQAQEKNINTLVEDYDRQINSLSSLDTKKYGWRVKELENKRSEAFIKLSYICPNIKKINEQIEIILN